MPSSESNKKMDDLLRGYAKKRQGQAKRSFELHPVSRRQLQNEARRAFRKPAKAVSWWTALGGFWPRAAFCSAVGFVLFLAVMFLLPEDRPAMPVAKLSVGASATAFISPPPPAPAEIPAAPPPVAAAAPAPAIAAAKPVALDEARVKTENLIPSTAQLAATDKIVSAGKEVIATNATPVLAKADSSRRSEPKPEPYEEFRTRGYGNAAPSGPVPANTPVAPKPMVIAKLDQDGASPAHLTPTPVTPAQREIARNFNS